MKNKWDGKITNMKISPLAYPELYRELETMHHKDRSDRFRVLALLGLLSLRSSVYSDSFSSNSTYSNILDKDNVNLQKTRDDLTKALLHSVDNPK